MEANIYKADGTVLSVQPKKGKYFSLAELQGIVNGYIEIIPVKKGMVCVLNEEGKLNGLPINTKATEICSPYLFPDDYIVGDVLICDYKLIK